MQWLTAVTTDDFFKRCKKPLWRPLSEPQNRYFKKYLEGVKKCLLDRLPSIGIRTGAWTSGSIKADEASKRKSILNKEALLPGKVGA